MKRYALAVLILALLPLTQTLSFGEGKVLLIAPELSDSIGFAIASEAVPMIGALNDAGYEVDVATESGKPLGTAKTHQ